MRAGLTLALALVAGSARAQTTVNLHAANEFGGLGAGLEMGDRNALVMGAGVGVMIGYSSTVGWISSTAPGAGVGYRRYLGNWFLGPTIGGGYHIQGNPNVRPGDGWRGWGVLGLGYRWRWDRSNWNTMLGGVAGVDWAETQDGPGLALGLSFSIGFAL